MHRGEALLFCAYMATVEANIHYRSALPFCIDKIIFYSIRSTSYGSTSHSDHRNRRLLPSRFELATWWPTCLLQIDRKGKKSIVQPRHVLLKVSSQRFAWIRCIIPIYERVILYTIVFLLGNSASFSSYSEKNQYITCSGAWVLIIRLLASAYWRYLHYVSFTGCVVNTSR